jgi:hypothetical protein
MESYNEKFVPVQQEICMKKKQLKNSLVPAGQNGAEFGYMLQLILPVDH